MTIRDSGLDTNYAVSSRDARADKWRRMLQAVIHDFRQRKSRRQKTKNQWI